MQQTNRMQVVPRRI